MNIEATDPLSLSKATMENPLATATPDSRQVDEFTRILFGQITPTPETHVTTQLQKQGQKIDNAFSGTEQNTPNIANPEEVLRAQREFAMAVISTDYTTKVAQYLSQGINKLTSMQ